MNFHKSLGPTVIISIWLAGFYLWSADTPEAQRRWDCIFILADLRIEVLKEREDGEGVRNTILSK